jgi:hypothetical protein
MQRLIVGFALVLVATFAGCKSEKINGPTGTNRVLFIGNSYLYWQPLPQLVQAMAASTGDQFTAVSVVGPNMALYDHLSGGDAVSTIAKGGWDYVVLQQGPSSVWYNRDSLRAATAIFDNHARKVNAKTALFSAWPQWVNRADFPRAIESYRLAAEDVNGLFMPVAQAWVRAMEMDPSLNLYEDGLHPNRQGAYLSALVVYATILKKTPRGLPAELAGVQLDMATATLLQSAAAQVTGF